MPGVDPVAQLAVGGKRRLVSLRLRPRDLEAGAPRRVLGHAGRPRVPEHDQMPPRAGERDVDAFRRHEHAPTVDAAERQHDDVLLLPLKRIHGTHLDHAVVLPGPVVVLDHLSDDLTRHDPGEVVDDGALLRFVKGDHTNLAGGHAELDNPRGDQSGEARLSRRILASTLLRHVPRR